MGPKKGKKSKGETEEQKAAREEAERLAKLAEEKRRAEEAEKKRLEELRIRAERKKYREEEIERLKLEYQEIRDLQESKLQQKAAEDEKEVRYLIIHSIFGTYNIFFTDLNTIESTS